MLLHKIGLIFLILIHHQVLNQYFEDKVSFCDDILNYATNQSNISIVGGWKAKIGDFPHVAAIFRIKYWVLDAFFEKDLFFKCGGTILNGRIN